MRTIILALAFTLTASSALAVNTCDTMPTTKQRENCWSGLRANAVVESDEYLTAVENSRKVPASVKKKVRDKRESVMDDARRLCSESKHVYLEDSCVIEQFEKFKDFAYKETSKYGVPDMRLN